jgi:flagellar basal-body rod protein FlgB
VQEVQEEMAINLDKALGIHPHVLSLRSRRAEVLAANLANADTPHYLARDMDFKAMLGQAQEGLALRTTHVAHLPGGGGNAGELLYRIPQQPAVDGNTVDAPLEKARFMENALRYQAGLQFLDGRIQGLLAAIRGE